MSTVITIALIVGLCWLSGWLEANRPGSWRPLRAIVLALLLMNAWSLAAGMWEQDWSQVVWGVLGTATALWWFLRLHEKIHRRDQAARFTAYLDEAEGRSR